MTCRDEVLDAVASLRSRNGGKPVAPMEIIREMTRAGSAYSEATIRSHVVDHMCVNTSGTANWPDLLRVGRGLYVPAEVPRPTVATLSDPATVVAGAFSDPSHDWPWEGAVQSVFVEVLARSGWTVTSVADTASKARGVDVLAAKGDRKLAAEVKGWPSTGYADPRRAGEVKPTQPSLQAGHWFSQAVTKALMVLDSHPGHESLVVVPDFPRYRDLAARTRTGRGRAGIHVVFVRQDDTESDTWTA